MPIRGSPNGARYSRPQGGRDRPEWVVAINRNGWSLSIVTAGRDHPVRAHAIGVTEHRFSRSVRKPGRASRRLHAGRRSGSIRASPELIPEEGSPPGSDIAYTAFDTSSTVRLRSPLSTVPAGIIVPAFPQRSPPRLLTAAACGGLGSAPDCRTRRALLHL